MPIIHAYLLEGRSEQQKADFIAEVTAAAGRTVGVQPGAVRVIITEMPNCNFGIGGISAKAAGR